MEVQFLATILSTLILYAWITKAETCTYSTAMNMSGTISIDSSWMKYWFSSSLIQQTFQLEVSTSFIVILLYWNDEDHSLTSAIELVCPHASFQQKDVDEKACRPRESMEIRVLIFTNPEWLIYIPSEDIELYLATESSACIKPYLVQDLFTPNRDFRTPLNYGWFAFQDLKRAKTTDTRACSISVLRGPPPPTHSCRAPRGNLTALRVSVLQDVKISVYSTSRRSLHP